MERAAVVPIRRRTQAERSATTCGRLLDATIDCLLDLGYAGTTTTEVSKRAGVSRGAQLHHYPTKAALVTAAVEHLYMQRHAEFVAAMKKLPAGPDRLLASIDLLWTMVSGRTFYAWLELAVAARTDPELRESVAAITRRFTETVDRTFADLFGAEGALGPVSDVGPAFAFALMEGLALHRIVLDDGRLPQILETFKNLARLFLPPRAPKERS